MGGIGSGRKSTRKTLVEECRRISAPGRFCPTCNRRALYLYLPPVWGIKADNPRAWRCRACHGLTYQSQSLHKCPASSVARDPAAWNELHRHHCETLAAWCQLHSNVPPNEINGTSGPINSRRKQREIRRQFRRWFEQLAELDKECDRLSSLLERCPQRPLQKPLTKYCAAVRYAPDNERHYLQSIIREFSDCPQIAREIFEEMQADKKSKP